MKLLFRVGEGKLVKIVEVNINSFGKSHTKVHVFWSCLSMEVRLNSYTNNFFYFLFTLNALDIIILKGSHNLVG